MERILKWAGIFFLSAAVGGMILMTCNGCPGNNKVVVDRMEYDSLLMEKVEANREWQWKVDSLMIEKEFQDSIIVTLNRTKEVFKDIAKAQKLEADKYAQMYRQAKALLDTGVMIVACDSLVDEYEILAGVHESLIHISDSVIIAQFGAIAIRDSIIVADRKYIAKQDSTIFKQDALYNKLYIYAYSQEQKHKQRKKLTWIAAAAALVAGILIAR
jgi:hypothetical protein